jgi:hypothetical protein
MVQEFCCNSDNRTSSSTLIHALKDWLPRFSLYLSLSAFFLFLTVFENRLLRRILEPNRDEVTGKGKVVSVLK